MSILSIQDQYKIAAKNAAILYYHLNYCSIYDIIDMRWTMTQLGKLLKEQRLAKNLSMKSVFEKTGIYDSKLSRIEKGEITEPSAKLIKQLSDLYESSAVDLFIACGYLQKSDLEDYQKCFCGIDKLTSEEKAFIQALIELFLKNRRGEEQ